ncbi:LbtU family siderophore porin [uncultured Desulfuromonas sp.]|uniref:LbtU family siderophore porin n=1 Tax=uncultured Desulfuromonas sp. TaxID=181013 RepID=UPI00262145E1|nr:LbtU family siderophore porin [uncultured Desulfuromonas sp.]
MQRLNVLFAVLAFSLVSLPAFASSQDPKGDSLEGRMQALESTQAEIYHTLAEKKAAGLASRITERITLSGLIEVEATAEGIDFADGGSDAASDLVLATAQLGFGLELTESLSGDLIFLFEEDATDLEVDEAAVNLELGPWSGRIGRQYLPFGVYNSHFVSDPLTLELGETRETALLAGYGRDLFTVSAFVFNGDAEKAGAEDHIRDWGVSLAVTPLEGIALGASYLSDLADTDADLLGGADYGERTGAWSAYLVAAWRQLEFSGEYLGATGAFAAADLDADGNGAGDEPAAWNLEIAWYPSGTLEVAARYEGSDQFAGQPETQYGLCTSWGAWENVSLSLEFLHGEFEAAFAEAGEEERELVTAQLAFEF